MQSAHHSLTSKISNLRMDGIGRYRRLVLILAAFWLFSPRQNLLAQTSFLPSLDPQKTITQYSLDIWQYDQGLPQSAVQSLAQTPEGYLWLGLEEGLVRFDGVRFTHFHKGNTEEFTYDDVIALFVDRAGALWIGTDGGGLLSFKDGRFSKLTTKDGLAHDVVNAIVEDKHGRLWVGTNNGLSELQNGRFKTYTTTAGLSNNAVLALAEDRGGNLWIGTDGGGLNRFKAEKFTVYTTKEGLANDMVRTIYEDKAGQLWIGTNSGLQCWREGKFTLYTTKDGLAHDFVRAIREDRAGSLWIGTFGGGLNRFREGKFSTFSAKHGLSNDFVKALYEDQEGSLWIGNYGGGLNRLRDGKFTNYSTIDGLSNNMVWTILGDRAGNLWFGTDNGLNRFKDGQFKLYPVKARSGPQVVTALYENRATPQGGIWIGIKGSGLYRWRDETLTHYTTAQGLSNNFVRAIIDDRRGNLWIGTDRGLNLFKNGKFQVYTTNDGLSSNEVRYLFEDKAGALWIGTRAGGLNRFQDEKFTIYTTKDGLSSDLIRPIYEDENPATGGTLWIGTNGGGLNRFKDGKFTRYSTKTGLFDDVIFEIIDDGRGNLWMSCNKGIFCVSKQELNYFAEGKIKTITSSVYGKADGMRTNECNGAAQPAGWKTRDGKLWFPTIAGVAMIDPKEIKTNTLPPPVVIEQILADHRPLPAQQNLKLPPGIKTLEFHYTGLSLLAPPRVRFRYKLDGFDEEWAEAGSRRVAFYTNIPPGDYTFHVMACNNDGVWNRTGAVLRFSLQPYFYETKFFYFLCLAALFAGGAGAYRLSVRQIRAKEAQAALRRANAELESRFKERTTELEQTKNFLSSIVEHLPLMLFIKDAKELRFVRFNRAGEEMIGLTQEEMLGKNDYDFFPKEQADFFTGKDRVVLSSGKAIDIAEEPIKTPRGIRWLYTRKLPIFGADAQPKYLLGVSEDITERKAAEEALRKSEEQFRLLFDLAPIGMAITKLDGKILRVNQAFCKLLDYTADELGALTLADLNYPDELTATLELREQLLLGKIPGFQMEKSLIAKGGQILQVILQSTLVRGGQGMPLHFISQIVDITARKQAEAALQISERRWLFALEGSGDGVWDWDAPTNNVYYSRRWKEMLGFAEQEIAATPEEWFSRIHADDYAEALERFNKHLREETREYVSEHRLRSKTGSYKWILARGKVMTRTADGKPGRMVGTHADITPRKRIEEEIRRLNEKLEQRVIERTMALRSTNVALEREIADRKLTQEQLQEGEARFRQLAENINEVLWIESRGDNRLLYVSPVYEKIWGRTCESLYQDPNSFLTFVHEEDRAVFKGHLAKQRKGEFSESEYRIVRPDGAIRWIRDRSFPIQDTDAQVYRSAGVAEDITLRKVAEDASRQNELLFRSILQVANDAIIIADSGGTIISWNQGAETIFGYGEEEMLGKPLTVLMPERYRSDHQKGVARLRATGQSRIMGQTVELHGLKKDGREFPLAITFTMRQSGAEIFYSGIIRDITEQKRAAEQIRQYSENLEKLVEERTKQIQKLELQRVEAEKLAVSGRMAARIAHEINNPLAGIQSSFLLLKEAIPVTHRYYEYTGVIEREIERIAKIIRQMYDLYRPEKESVYPFRLQQTIQEIVTLLRANAMERGVTIESETSQAAKLLTLSEGLLRQVLYNVINNAIDASPADRMVKIHAAVVNEHAVITVADQGAGIPPEIRAQIFEPFFTTKTGQHQHGGLGLGLSVSKSIIESLGGQIGFESKTGEGTVFKIVVPAKITAAAANHEASPLLKIPAPGNDANDESEPSHG